MVPSRSKRLRRLPKAWRRVFVDPAHYCGEKRNLKLPSLACSRETVACALSDDGELCGSQETILRQLIAWKVETHD